jgi:hypothetical protein
VAAANSSPPQFFQRRFFLRGDKIPPMKVKRLFAQLLLASAFTAWLAAAGAARSQDAPAAPRPPAREPYSPYPEIHVDQACRILPETALPVSGTRKPKPFRDPVICHLESVESSEHIEETISGNQLLRNRVNITEQEYLLQDIEAETEVFVVEQAVPEGWVVDSDPQPTKVVGSTAIFRVYAQPGQTVRLHVGLRHAKPLKPRIVRASASTP